MRKHTSLTLFVSALMLGGCQSVMLGDTPDKAAPPDWKNQQAQSTPAQSAGSGADTGADSNAKAVIVKQRGTAGVKELKPQEDQPQAGQEKERTIGDLLSELLSGENQAEKPAAEPGVAAGSPPAPEKPSDAAPKQPSEPAKEAAQPSPSEQSAAADKARSLAGDGRIDRSYSAAYGVYKPLAEKGHAFAQYEMGLMYLHGYGVPTDSKTAAMWLSKAAIQGHPDAKVELNKLSSLAEVAAEKDEATTLPGENAAAETKTGNAAPDARAQPAAKTEAAQPVALTNTTKTTAAPPPKTITPPPPPKKAIAATAPKTDAPKDGAAKDNAAKATETKPAPETAPPASASNKPLKLKLPSGEAPPPQDNEPPTIIISGQKVTTDPTGEQFDEPIESVVLTDPAATLAPPDTGGTPVLGTPVLMQTEAVAVQQRKPETPAAAEPKAEVQTASKPAAAPPQPATPAPAQAPTQTATQAPGPQSSPAPAENQSDLFSKGLSAYRDGNYSAAYQAWRPLAENGEPESQTRLGYLFEHGKGVDQDYQQAVTWYTKAANQGEPAAQFNLGVMYRKGRGVPKNDKIARAWYEKAADQGHPTAERVVEVMKAYKIGE